MKANQLTFCPLGILSYNFRTKLDGKKAHDEAFCYMVYCDEDYVIAMTWDDNHNAHFHLLKNNDVAFRPVNDDMVQVETICSRANKDGICDIRRGINMFLLLEVNSKVGVFRVGLWHDNGVKLWSRHVIEYQ